MLLTKGTQFEQGEVEAAIKGSPEQGGGEVLIAIS